MRTSMSMSMTAVAALLLAFLCGCRQKTAAGDLYDLPAALRSGLPYPVLRWRIITTYVDRNTSTMATLFGDDAAVEAAKAGIAYPAGAVLGLVTWRESEDPHWFGARIPGRPVSVEFVVVGRGVDETFTGTPWREAPGSMAKQIQQMRPAPVP